MRDLPQSGRRLCVTSCNYLPRWSIWPVGSFGIYRPWKNQTQTLELCHLLASNSEIRICVAPSIEISLDSNTTKPAVFKVSLFQRHQCWVEAAKHFATSNWNARGVLKLEKLTLRKHPSCQRLHRNWVSWSHFLVEDRHVANVFETDMELEMRDLLQSGRKFVCVTSCNYLLRWSIWPVGSFGIYRPWKRQTQTQELCHLLASNSEIGICVAPSIERSLDSKYTDQQFLKFRFSKGTNAELKLRSTLQQNAGLVVL